MTYVNLILGPLTQIIYLFWLFVCRKLIQHDWIYKLSQLHTLLLNCSRKAISIRVKTYHKVLERMTTYCRSRYYHKMTCIRQKANNMNYSIQLYVPFTYFTSFTTHAYSNLVWDSARGLIFGLTPSPNLHNQNSCLEITAPPSVACRS